MWKGFCVLVALALAPASASAQAATTLLWDIPGAVPGVVSTYTHTVVVNSVTVSAAPVCVAKGTTDTTCSVPIPALVNSSNTISVTEAAGGQTATMTITGLNPNNGPKQPANGRVSVTVTVNITGP